MKQQSIKEKIIEECRERFNIDTVFHKDNFEDPKYINMPYYSETGAIKAFEQFLSQSLDRIKQEVTHSYKEIIRNMKLDVRPEIREWTISKNRDEAEGFNYALDKVLELLEEES